MLEAPGFMLRNYGERTVLVTAIGHVAYGALRRAAWLGLVLAVLDLEGETGQTLQHGLVEGRFVLLCGVLAE